MSDPVQWDGAWWQQAPDGSWFRWDEPSGSWVPHAPSSSYGYAGPSAGYVGPSGYADPSITGFQGYAPVGAPKPKLAIERASFGIRLGAAIIDGIVLAAAWFLLFAILGGFTLLGSAASGGVEEAVPVGAAMGSFVMLYIVGLVGGVLYFALQEGGARGQTLGKRAVGIRIIDVHTGAPIGIGKGFLRVIGRYISQLPCYLGYLWMLWDEDKQTWHDKMCECIVVPVSAMPFSN
ncbi:MAG TPA: RDD family protein [Actinomycetota bacterium]|nr:RDD family protein [Actinomycetota bacterium]